MGASTGYTSDGYVESYADKGFKGKNGRAITLLDVNPIETATTGNIGDMLIGSFGTYVKITTNGTDTNWQRSADKSQYKLYEDFENYTSAVLPVGWVKYGNTNTALSYPDNFGGSASASSYTTVANTNLTGAKVFRTSLATADNGKGVYKPFSISNGEKGLPFIFETQINITKLGSAEWASNAQIWVVGSNDNFVSNFQNIPLTNYVVSKSGLLKGSFIDSSATLTNFRLCIHFSGLTDTFNVDLDEVKIYQSNADTLSPNSKKVISSWGYKSGATGGTGSTNTKIAYINGVNRVEQNGSIFDYFTYNQSPTLGDSWVAKSTFKVGISYEFEVTGTGYGGISINSNQLTTTYGTISDDNMLTPPSYLDSPSIYGERIIQKGDVLRIHCDSFSMNANFKLIFSIDENTGSNVIASGENFMPISVARTSTQSIPNTTITIVTFDSNPKNDSRYDGAGKFYPNINYGWLKFKGQLNFAFGGGIRSIFLYKNGSLLREQNFDPNDSTSNSTPFDFEIEHTPSTANDYYEIRCYQSNGASINLLGTQTFVDVSRTDKPFSMNLFQAAGMVLSPTDNVLPAQFSRSTTQSMTNATNNQIVWDTENYNPSKVIQMNTTTGRITNYGSAGYYKFTGYTASTSFSSSANCYNRILMAVNGATPKEVGFNGSSATGSCYVATPFEFTVYLTNGSYVDIFNYPNLAVSVPYNIGMLEVQRIDKTAVSAGGGYTKWQRKFLNSLFSTTGTISALSFSNLEIGKHYRVSIQLVESATGGGTYVQILNGATILGRMNHGATTNITTVNSVVFIATSTSLTFNAASNGNGFQGDGTTDTTYATLEELPQHIQTNQWT